MWEISDICSGISYCRLFPILVTDKIRKLMAMMIIITMMIIIAMAERSDNNGDGGAE